jgi:predicted N-acetyltransferase YhbS
MVAPKSSRSRDHDMTIRAVVPGDAEAVTQVVNAAFVVEQIAIAGDRTSPESIRRMMDTGQFLVAEDPSGIVGCVYVEPRGEHSYLGLLSVDPLRQGTGLGRRLLAAAEDFAREAGSQAMDLRIISPRAELLPFYRRLGYAETGSSPFPAEVQTKIPSHFIHLSKPLV